MSSPTLVVLFEDERAGGLTPITDTRPAFEVRLGSLCLRERAALAFAGTALRVKVREELLSLTKASLPELVEAWPSEDATEVLLLNGRVRAGIDTLRQLASVPAGVCHAGGDLVFARVPTDRARAFLEDRDDLADLPRLETPVGLGLLRRPWDVVHANGAALCADFRELKGVTLGPPRIFGVEFDETLDSHPAMTAWSLDGPDQAIIYPGVHVVEADNVLYGPGARVRPGAVLDAERGPVLLGAGCVVHPQAVVVGPAWIGPGSVVNPGARLREGSSIGAWCKVGGEVEESILHDLSNKQHDGFLGHAILGSWVNLGADTNGSDLKNNYGAVKVDLGDGPIDTGQRFVGPMIGDHAKTGINTMLSTGCVVGVCANVFGSGFPPRRIPAFTWGGAESLVEYDLARAVETASVVFGRRHAVWTPDHESLLTLLFERSATERAALRR